MRPRRLLASVAVAALATVPFAAKAEVIGAATAVQPDAMQTPDGGAQRPLAAGDPVNLLDLLQTSASGLAVVIFNDESTLSVGPGSEVLIDEFVYDGSGGSLSMELGGVARYIGGRISKEEDVEIETQHGTVGIRGGMALIEAFQETWAANQFGVLTCSGGGETEVITARGFACIIGADGVTVVPVPKDKYELLLRILAGDGGAEDEGITSLIALFCDSDFAINHKDCLAPPGGLAHTQGEDLGTADEAEDESEVDDKNQEDVKAEDDDDGDDDDSEPPDDDTEPPDDDTEPPDDDSEPPDDDTDNEPDDDDDDGPDGDDDDDDIPSDDDIPDDDCDSDPYGCTD
jgi:hypothetical protein